MLTRRRDALIITANEILSPLNSNAADGGFRVLNVTPHTPRTSPQFGRKTNLMNLRFYAVVAGIN